MKTGQGDEGKMQPTIVKTYALPQVLERDPASVAYATRVPVRVVVKNVGGAAVFVGFASGDVQSPDGVGTDVWIVNPSESDVFVLAPKQTMYASSAGPNGRVTVQVSEAFPYLVI